MRRIRAKRRGKSEPHVTKILVIGDDTIVHNPIVQLLEEDDSYKVFSAEDGVRGMALFLSEQPDLVITDIIMPEQEGILTITEMLKAKPDTKIIAISGGGRIGNTDFLKIAQVPGAMAVIGKPFDLDEFMMIVRDWLAARARRADRGQAA
jgi:two-component system, chemotaxis family, chemotaxis protein CheY